MIIKKTSKEELPIILDLIWKTFLKYEAPDYTESGIEEFKNFIDNKDIMESLNFYAAYENNILLGIIATRSENTHISLFFIDEKYQGKGIGRKLYETIKEINQSGQITVNSSPYAVNIYKKLGFIPTMEEQNENGMRYTPMKALIKKKF